MRLQPIVYTSDTGKAVEWYQAVLGMEPSYRSDMWSTFQVGDAVLAIHYVEETPDGSRVGMSLVASEALESLVERWQTHVMVSVTRGIRDEPFGRSILLTDPDGTPVQVNEH